MGYTQISASNITELNGNKLASGTILFLATDQNDQPISFQLAGGGQALRRPISATVTNGAIAAGMQVPDPATTSPSGILYRIWVRDAATNQIVLDYRKVQFQGSSFNLDNYVPSAAVVAPPATGAVTGPLNVTGDVAATGTLSGGAGSFTGVLDAGTVNPSRIAAIRVATAFGGADVGAQVNAAIADLGSVGGIVIIPAGSYSFSTSIVIGVGIKLIAHGAALTYTGNGDAIQVRSGTAPPYLNGSISGLRLSGNANANVCGIHHIDTIGFVYDDVSVWNFTGAGACAMWLDNQSSFSERTSWRKVSLGLSSKLLKFSNSGGTAATQSFMYSTMSDLHLQIADGQIGISVEGPQVVIQNCVIEFKANINDPTTPATLLSVTGGAQIYSCEIQVFSEQTSGAGAIGVNVDATSMLQGTGVLATNGMADSVAPGGVFYVLPAINPSTNSVHYEDGSQILQRRSKWDLGPNVTFALASYQGLEVDGYFEVFARNTDDTNKDVVTQGTGAAPVAILYTDGKCKFLGVGPGWSTSNPPPYRLSVAGPAGLIFASTDTGLFNNAGGLKHLRSTTGNIAASGTATLTLSWPTPFADANYTVTGAVVEATGSLQLIAIEAVNAGGVTVLVKNMDSVNAHTGQVHLIAMHD